MSHLGQRTNQAEKRDLLLTPHHLVLYQDLVEQAKAVKISAKQSVLDFNVQSSLP